jgi:hypothetical protein
VGTTPSVSYSQRSLCEFAFEADQRPFADRAASSYADIDERLHLHGKSEASRKLNEAAFASMIFHCAEVLPPANE